MLLARRCCSTPNCPNTSDGGKCAACRTRDNAARADAGNYSLYGRRWRAAAQAFLREVCACNGKPTIDLASRELECCGRCHGTGLANRFCKECLTRGEFVLATEVDHIVPHKGDRTLFWNRTNWQGLCNSCHSYKTVTRDGGFGGRGMGSVNPLA